MFQKKWIWIIGIMIFTLWWVASYETPTAYSRSEWKHWVDENKNCRNTRAEVLIAQSIEPVTFRDTRTCRVAMGLWICPYTGDSIREASRIDIDHVVPLREAHLSGGFRWSSKQKLQFANDLELPQLLAVSASANRSKGARDPALWMPTDSSYWCKYLADWQKIKRHYGLRVDLSEFIAIQRIKWKHCRR